MRTLPRFRPLGGPSGLLVVTGLLLAACGGAPTQTADDGARATDTGGEAAEAAVEGSVQEVLGQVEGLEGQERLDRLVELAEEASGTVSLYTVLTNQSVEAFKAAFEADTGLTLEVYRASSEPIQQRILQESASGNSGADVVETVGPDMIAFSREGVLVPYDTPLRDELVEEALYEDWTVPRFAVFAPGWNTDLVTEPPASWEDLADPRFDGLMAVEATAGDWYMALSQHWQEEGRSEEEIQQLWHDIATGAAFISGHSTIRELLVSGEYGLTAVIHTYMIPEVAQQGAPVDGEPYPRPVFVRPNGIGLLEGPNPAGGMAFTDWLLSHAGQQVYVDELHTPAHQDLFALEDYFAIDVEAFVDEVERWRTEYEQLARRGDRGDG